ncbi:MAG: helix-turn-helix domain-containing protein [Bacillaceae bacterium]
MSFSDKLQTLRKEKGLSQEQLAEILDVSRQAVSKWESGQTYPEIDKLIKISDLFQISLDELLKEKSTPSETLINDESEEDEDEDVQDEWLMTGGFIIGMAIGFITDNFMWGLFGCFLGLGAGYIIRGIKRKM